MRLPVPELESLALDALDVLAVPMAVFDAAGALVAANGRWRAAGGAAPGADDGTAREVAAAIAALRPYRTEYALGAAAGRRWTALRVEPFVSGGRRYVAVIREDVTPQRRADERHRTVVGELRHRARNIMAVVQSIATQTLRSSESPEEFAAALLGRLRALARAQALVTETDLARADLRAILDGLLEPYAGRGRIRLSGEAVLVRASAAMSLTLMLHEMATNAAKYGALSADGGELAVEWGFEPTADGRLLRLVWSETAAQRVAATERRGFGTRLIEFSAGHEFNGTAVMAHRPQGVAWELRLPWGPRIEAD